MGGEYGGAGRTLVVIPTYDERYNLASVLSRLHAAAPWVSALVVDDASPDGTGAVADELAAVDERVAVLHRSAKTGLGPAYLAGFGWALARDFDVIAEMDADGSHAPEELPRLLAGLDGTDVVLGSRYVPGGRVYDWPWYRRWLSRGGNVYSRLALGVPIADLTGGFRAYRRAVLEKVDLRTVSAQGYCFQVDLARRAVQAGFGVVELPITFVDRRHGTSKMTGSVVREALWQITRWGVTRWISTRP